MARRSADCQLTLFLPVFDTMLLRGVFGVVRRAGFSSNRLDVAAERPTLPPRATLNSTPLSSASRQDVVFLRGIQVFGRHGASKAERERGEKFSIDVALTTDVFWAGESALPCCPTDLQIGEARRPKVLLSTPPIHIPWWNLTEDRECHESCDSLLLFRLPMVECCRQG